MKKLLLITNSIIFMSLTGSCQSTPKTVTVNETKPKTTITPTQTDSVKMTGQTNSSGTAGEGGGIKKDTASKPVKTKAIVHSAPNQTQIDSVKKAKTKNKRKK